jgi:hypothetical protein
MNRSLEEEALRTSSFWDDKVVFLNNLKGHKCSMMVLFESCATVVRGFQ